MRGLSHRVVPPPVCHSHPLEAAFLSLGDDSAVASPQPSRSLRPAQDGSGAAATTSVFAMFLEANALSEPLKVLTIDAATGAQTSRVVKGYDTHGESTRLFEFNRATGMFVTFENDYSQPPVGPHGLLPMHMYSVSPSDGAVTKVAVTISGGARAADAGWLYPTGYKYDSARRAMVLATGPTPSGNGPLPPGGFSFHSVDGSGVATKISSTPGPANSLGLPTDPLAGWIHALSPSGQVSYRFGQYNVSSQSASGAAAGLGTTNLSDAGSSFSKRTPPPSHAAYLSLDAREGPAGSTKLYSMAPRSGQAATIDLVEWSANDAVGAQSPPPRVIASLGDAHQPSLFGDIAATMRGDEWAALTVQHPGVILNGGWALSIVANVSAAAAAAAAAAGDDDVLRTREPAAAVARLLPLKPRVGGGTCSLSGIGFPER